MRCLKHPTPSPPTEPPSAPAERFPNEVAQQHGWDQLRQAGLAKAKPGSFKGSALGLGRFAVKAKEHVRAHAPFESTLRPGPVGPALEATHGRLRVPIRAKR